MKTTIFGRFMQYCFPFYAAKRKYKDKGANVAIQRAPEPTDLIWINFGHSNKRRILRKIGFWTISMIILIISGAVIYGLALVE